MKKLNETSANSNGVYSLYNGWLKEPVKDDIPDDIDLEPELSEWIDKSKEANTIEEIDSFIDDIYKLRQESIINDGEYGKGNLIFKQIRNQGILQDLKDKKVSLENKEMSIESLNEDSFDDYQKSLSKNETDNQKSTVDEIKSYFRKKLGVRPYGVKPEVGQGSVGLDYIISSDDANLGLHITKYVDDSFNKDDLNTLIKETEEDLTSKFNASNINLWQSRLFDRNKYGNALKQVELDWNFWVDGMKIDEKLLENKDLGYDVELAQKLFDKYVNSDLSKGDLDYIWDEIMEQYDDVNLAEEVCADLEEYLDDLYYEALQPEKLEEEIDESDLFRQKNEACIKEYRQWAGLGDDDLITEENINEWALNRVSCNENYDYDDLKEVLLGCNK